jgi:hypothetical protein
MPNRCKILQTQDILDPFSNFSRSGSGIFDLIQLIQIGKPTVVWKNFNTEQRQNLNEAIDRISSVTTATTTGKPAEPTLGAIAPTEITAPIP